MKDKTIKFKSILYKDIIGLSSHKFCLIRANQTKFG